ncbi:hypothetical protein D3C71_1121260 [compost metagenome]
MTAAEPRITALRGYTVVSLTVICLLPETVRPSRVYEALRVVDLSSNRFVVAVNSPVVGLIEPASASEALQSVTATSTCVPLV